MTDETATVPLFPVYRALREKRRAEEQNRREWLEDITRRLGLVAEVHRCRVWKRGEGDWARRCLRPGCPAGRPLGWAASQQYALGDALAHAGAFLPLPPEETPDAGLDWTGTATSPSSALSPGLRRREHR